MIHMFICQDSYTMGWKIWSLPCRHNFIFERVRPSYKICPIPQLCDQRDQSDCPSCGIKEAIISLIYDLTFICMSLLIMMIKLMFYFWVEDLTAYEHDDLFCILGVSQWLMIYRYIYVFVGRGPWSTWLMNFLC